jgi:hypothetical protein
MTDHRCPACGSDELVLVDRTRDVPTNSCLLLDSSDEALELPKGDIELTFCDSCGFVFNRAYTPGRSEYSARYEETQGYSPRFVSFARDLAQRWVAAHDLVGSTVLEIGCGSMGEFLRFMVDAGAGHGVGIDPALNVERIHVDEPARFTWLAELYGEDHASIGADAIVCRHTLEHLPSVREVLTNIRGVIGDRRLPVLFEVPDVARVLEEVAFWDVYYEHCSYFSAGSLARLFRRCGFEVLDLTLEYDDQYLVIEARPSDDPHRRRPLAIEDDMDRLRDGVERYIDRIAELRRDWTNRLREHAGQGGRAVIWGAGSKGVAYLTGLGVGHEVTAAVDINPTKRSKFMAGSGHRIVSPDDLVALAPDLVVAMNPVYVEEIRDDLQRLGVDADVLAV